jgi:hypothetical protein
VTFAGKDNRRGEMNEHTVWKVCREVRRSYLIRLMIDPDYGIIGVLVRRLPDHHIVQHPKGTRPFWKFRRMYQASRLVAEFPNVTNLSVAA